MFERWVAGVVGILAVAAGVLLAVLPFSLELGGGEQLVTVHGRPPIVSAWSSVRRGPLLLWAVSDETGHDSVELRSGGRPYAAREARTRLLGAAALIVGGTLAVVFARRRRRSSKWAGSSPAPGRALPPPVRRPVTVSPTLKGSADE